MTPGLRVFQSHNSQTLEAFIVEAGLPQNAGITKPGDWTIEKILEEKKQFDTSIAFEKKGDDQDTGWALPAPSEAVEPEVSIRTNVLCVSGYRDNEEHGVIFITAADRSWSRISSAPPFALNGSILNAHGSPVLSISSLPGGYVFSSSMSGQLALHDSQGRLLDKCRDHLKYAVHVVSGLTRQGKWIVATAGWDQKVHIYAPEYELAQNFEPNADNSLRDDEPYIPGLLRDPIHTINMPTNPESMVLVQHPDTMDLYLIGSRRDSTFLYYYCITPTAEESSSSRSSEVTYSVQETGKQNLAPHSNAWIAFTPSCLAVCPTDPQLLAVATSHLPHMKLIIVRLLFPTATYDPNSNTAAVLDSQQVTPASQARAALALQDREDAAIKLHVSTMAPQTPYSTPQVVWRPSGQGVFINSDDGVIRGVDTQSGKVVATLKAHEVGSKVRTLFAGWEAGGKNEILVSGGFDKKVFVWRV